MLQIRRLRKLHGKSQQEMAELLGVTQATFSGWENGKFQIDTESTLKLAEYFNVTLDYLIRGAPAPPSRGVKVPVYGYIQAGVPIEAIEEILDYEEITPEMAATGDFFGLVIRGDSMQPRMHEGDVVIVRKQPDVDSGSFAVVLVNGKDATVKKVIKTGTSVMLMPLNSAFEPTVYADDEVESLPVMILGKVVEVRGKLT